MFEVLVKDLRLTGFHGINPEEKIKGQDFLFNVVITLEKQSFKNPGSLHADNLYDDNISETVNYSEIISIIKKVNSSKKFDLLETLSEVLAEKILSYSPMISGVSVTVEKTSPPITEDIGSVGVKLKLEKSEFVKNSAGSQKSLSMNDSCKADTGSGEIYAGMGTVFYLSIGTNTGDREKNLREAVRILSAKEIVKIKKVSSIYETEPMYLKEQENFYNIVLKGVIKSDKYSAFEFFGFLKEIEFRMNRQQNTVRNSPRIIDLDLLYFGNEKIDTDILTLPHPKMLERNFVIIPLLEIEPGFSMQGWKIRDLIAKLSLKEKAAKAGQW
ncbi:MAG: 2-amino-4-hydroxy-6-hydroxymethyldihydropteridine diphosphokinase [Actinobacteria bacterium]|nr:2-amino-4-hydroxy-6-hydroxymethyldihydropteridine diphosphokinase [Actinomycetota bacterium]